MPKSLSNRTLNIAASLTVAIDSLAKKMIAEGKDVVSLGAGEPDFPTPEPICKAAHCAIDSGKTRYTAPVGILELRKKICEKLSKENGLRYEPEQITVTSGAKHAVFNSLAALINPGDEVIIPAPYWVTYPEVVKWLGGVPVFVDGLQENDFKITAEQLKKVCNDKTKAILMNNPCNPTGSVYSREELEALAKVIVENDLYCISDEVYEYFVYQGTFTSIASIEGMKDRSIVINGFSAGAHLCGCLGTMWNEDFLKDAFHVSGDVLRPAGMILGYPVITSGKFAHGGSCRNLLGDRYEAEKEKFSLENRVTGDTIPAFLWHTTEDNAVPVENSILFYSALHAAGIPVEMHIFPKGSHGLALANAETAHDEGNIVDACTVWISLAARWVKEL